MNAAAAHAAFVTTVSAASMYWLLRHAQHARDINIHKLQPLPEKESAWAVPISCRVEHPFLERHHFSGRGSAISLLRVCVFVFVR